MRTLFVVHIPVTIIIAFIAFYLRSKYKISGEESGLPLTKYNDSGETFTVGQQILQWRIERITSVEDLDITVLYLTHQTGAHYIHLANLDKNKFFSVNFRTPCIDDSGLPHILEHLVLCGSHKYPVRDPFFSMIKRSLNTFMNAWTASDHTSYLFSTMNEVDFFNLMDIYLDAVFHPLLREADFMQEGWRVEAINGNEKTIKGVVFNEMKGVMGDANNYLIYAINRHLFPDTPYALNNGGDPLHIPELKYETLVAYHKKHYAAKNALFFTYGDVRLRAVLDRIEIAGGESVKQKLQYKLKDNRVLVRGPPESISKDPNKQLKVVVAYQTNHVERDNHFYIFCMSIVSHLLLDATGPLYRSLIESRLAPSLITGSGFEEMDLLREQTSFIVGVTGIDESSVEEIERVINSTLISASKTKFPDLQIQSLLSRIELEEREINIGKGKSLAMKIVPLWMNGGIPEQALYTTIYITRLRKLLEKDPFFLQKLIDTQLVRNDKRLVIIQMPDEKFQSKQKELEHQLAQSLEISPKYEQVQSAPVSILPTLTVKDIPAMVSKVNISVEENRIRNSDRTNGIVYFTVYSILHEDIDAELLTLFSYAITRIGTSDLNRTELAIKRDLLGGIEAEWQLFAIPFYQIGISITSKCIASNINETVDLVKKLIKDTRWDDLDVLKILMDQLIIAISEKITAHGSQYATSYSSASIGDQYDIMHERLNGVTQINYLKALATKPTAEISELLKQLASRLFQTLSVLVTADPERTVKIEFPSQPNPTQSLVSPKTRASQLSYVAIPFSVNYVAMTIKTGLQQFKDQDHAYLMLLSALLKPLLHVQIREKGGAYGSGASFSQTGIFSMTSYRDPQTLETVSAYDSAVRSICSLTNITEVELQEGKLRLFQIIDKVQMPHDKASFYFYQRITDEMRQQYRTLLLEANLGHLQRVCQTYLLPHVQFGSDKMSVTILGDKDNIPEAIARGDKGWKVCSEFI